MNTTTIEATEIVIDRHEGLTTACGVRRFYARRGVTERQEAVFAALRVESAAWAARCDTYRIAA